MASQLKQKLQTKLNNYRNATSNSGINTVNLDPITYNSRYPGFDEANYRKLESKANELGLTGYQKEQFMDNLYQQVLPKVQDDIKNSDRRKYINDASYEVSQIQDKDAKLQAKGKLTVTELSQKLKEKYNIDPTINDEQLFNDWIKSIPNGEKLLVNYLNNGDRELLYKGGLEEKVTAPKQTESSVGGIQSIINKQSELESDSLLGKVNKYVDYLNPIGKLTEGLDWVVQKIPVIDGRKQVENLANKINNLTEDDISGLYQRYLRMIENGTSDKWQNDKRSVGELMWDGLINKDQEAIDRINTLRMADYSEALKQDAIQRNQWGDQLWSEVSNGASEEDIYKNIDNSDLPGIVSGPAKAAVWTADKMKNLLNFIGGSYGGLENLAEGAAVGTVALNDIAEGNYYAPVKGELEGNEEAFKAYVANQTANFGEGILDAPDTLMGNTTSPNAFKFIGNIPGSFLKTLSSKVRGKTNPLDTKVGLLKMLFTEDGQQAMINRYGSVEAIANSMNTDPVGFASDIIDWGDKINWVFNKTAGTPREQIGDVTDAMSDSLVKGGNIWTTRVKGDDGEYLKNEDGTYVTKDIDISGIQGGLNKISDTFRLNGWDKTANLTDLVRDTSLNPEKIPEDAEKVAYDAAETAGKVARDVYDAGVNAKNKIGEISKSYKQKSADVWDKVKNAPTRAIPEKIVENDLKLTPKERERVEKSGITAANFILKEKIAGLSNKDKIVALQDISSDAYNNVTNTFKNEIPSDYREKSTVVPKMLKTMVNALESSDIVKEEYGDYINKVKEMAEYDDYSPYEKLAIRRDFDAIVGNDLFKKDGTLKGDFENGIIAGWRAELNDEINEIGKKYGIDVKDENSRISNAITIRDGLIRSVSQGKKNNAIGLQDLGIGAILSSGQPVNALGIIAAKKFWDAKSGNIAQSFYNMNSNPLKPANTQKGPSFIKKGGNGNRTLMLDSIDNDTSTN